MIINVILSCIIILYLSFNSIKTIKKTYSDNTVYLPKFYLYVINICVIAFFIFYCINSKYMEDSRIAEALIYWGGIIVVLGCALSQINWKIEFNKNDDCFYYYSMFGRKTVVNYKQIIRVRKYKEGIMFKTKNRHFYIDTWAENLDDFMQVLNLAAPYDSFYIKKSHSRKL